jgi:flagellar protein FliL
MERTVATAKTRRGDAEGGADNVSADDGAVSREPPTRKSKIGLWIGLIVVLLAGVAGGVFFWQSASNENSASEQAPAALLPLQFFSMDPPFVTNFEGNQEYRFLQITIRIATREPALLTLFKDNEPVLRNDLLMLFSNQQAAVLATIDGKEALREEAMRVVQESVSSLGGDPTLVERVLFTSLVMQ